MYMYTRVCVYSYTTTSDELRGRVHVCVCKNVYMCKCTDVCV